MAKTNETLSKPLEKKKKTQPDFGLWARNLSQAIEEAAPSKQPTGRGQLLLISTPIGNLGDITLRALWALTHADAILCEDTRNTGLLLQQYGIKKPLISCHDHNEEQRIKEVLSRLAHGETLALVSDAGTPLISDPGFRLVRACREAGFAVYALPGACALLCALASAGLPSDRFLFVGFLPTKPTARRKALSELAQTQATMIFYESPQRLSATLKDMGAAFSGEREACTARELTKLYEETRSGSLDNLIAHYEKADTPKGEMVILVAPFEGEEVSSSIDLDACLREALKTLSLRDAVALVAQQTGIKKSEVYQRALELS